MRTILTDWYDLLYDEFKNDYYRKLMNMLKEEYQKETVYPEKELIYNALNVTPYANVKAVILGQDPYHTPGYAHGLAFSVTPETSLPKSLVNIFISIHAALCITSPVWSRWQSNDCLGCDSKTVQIYTTYGVNMVAICSFTGANPPGFL